MNKSILIPKAGQLPIRSDLGAIICSDHPLLDLRAPTEVAAGTFPQALNYPLMTDAEREAIGKRYKQQGQDAAIALGVQRVSGAIKAERVQNWVSFFQHYPDAALYCFRGGLRSQVAQQWLFEYTGNYYPRIAGGYKAMRQWVLNELEQLANWLQPLVMSGRTGSGKTLFLNTCRAAIDLEGLANHRGSAFGGRVSPQPSQASFENALVVRLLQQQAQHGSTLLFEDESRNIGSIHLPTSLLQRLAEAPLIVLETSDEERVALTYQAYIVETYADFVALHANPELGFRAFEHYLLASLGKIQRRLGGIHAAQVKDWMQTALSQQQRTGDLSGHQHWIRFILLRYYDPMYNYQLSQKQQRILFKGTTVDIQAFLAERVFN